MPNKTLIASIATGLVSIAESAVLGKGTRDGEGLAEGYGRLEGNCSALLNLDIESRVDGSQYNRICIVSRASLREFIHGLFSNEVRGEISAMTGFEYAIDYFVFNENSHIPEQFQRQQHYANFWHTDEMFSANCLKVFIPVEDVGLDDGPMHYLSATDTRELTRESYVRAPDLPPRFADRILRLTGVRGDMALVRPHVCMHRAGIPVPGSVRRQIMLQLNPARSWRCRRDIHQLQFQREINLPFIRKYSAAYEAL